MKTNKLFWKLTEKILFVLLLISFNSKSQTNIPAGNISGTWTTAGSPYLIQGHIMIPSDSTLNIMPGVVISFQGNYKLNVQGNLQAIGTLTDSITFSPSDSTIGWGGIRFAQTSATQDSSRIKYCKLVYGWAHGTLDNSYGGALYFNTFSKVVVSNCRISNNYAATGGGIYCYYSSPIISNNIISKNNGVGGGIYCEFSSPQIFYNSIKSNHSGASGCCGAGGGIQCVNSSPLIMGNLIEQNVTAVGGGGGIACLNSSNGSILNNTISNNTAEQFGGGIYCDHSSPAIKNNVINSNTVNNTSATQACGGGIATTYSSSLIMNNTITYNTVAVNGGGIYNVNSNLTIKNNNVNYNQSGAKGGGIYCDISTSLVQNNYICNNFSNKGAGIYCGNANFQQFVNNVLCNNSSASSGGGIYCEGNVVSEFTNCTISNNKSNTIDLSPTNGGGGIFCIDNSDPIFTNCIVYNNLAANSNGNQVFLDDDASDPVFKYCNVEGGSSSFYINGNVYLGQYTNNINVNPQYSSPSLNVGNGFNGTTANWALQGNSLCINKGKYSVTGLNLPSLDIGSNNRIIADTIDIGAFEFNSCNSTSINTSVTQNGITLTALSNGSYQWLNCNNNFNIIPGSTGQNFSPNTNGSYAVKITKSGCVDTSDCFNITTVGIEEIHPDKIIQLYPNPANTSFYLTGISVKTKIRLYNMLGKLEISTEIESDNKFDISHLSQGIYNLSAESSTGIIFYKIVIAR